MKLLILEILCLSLLSGCASAKEAECYNTSKALITDLYNKFPINGDEVIENKNIKTLSNFFDKNLTNLLIKDQECSARNNGVCNIDFNILIHSQDTPNKYKTLQDTDNLVTVKVEYHQYSEFINFVINKESSCKKIGNIKYDDGSDLIKMLRK
ncbi:TPA: hypothetical protein OXQ01_000373 [Acinetobacter baumannii]|nr:hypothetical protein [Acinetobacter baumannii]